MAGLSGDFITMPLKDLVAYLGSRRASGNLSFEYGSAIKGLTIREGFVINASSNQPREYLGQFLINNGTITEDQFTRAYETQKQTRVPLGRILVMTGTASETAVLEALNLKFRETLLEAMGWRDGTFVFDRLEPSAPDEGMELNIDLTDLHQEGEFRQTAWEAFRAAFPSGSLRLELHEDRLPSIPRAGSLDERLIQLIRDGHSIDEMILALHATDFFLYQRLYQLYRQEAIRPRAQETAPEGDLAAIEDASSDGQALIRQARQALLTGELREAELLARRSCEVAPSAEAAELLMSAEEKLLALLRKRLVEGEPVPILAVPPTRVKELPLSAPERYLLSRVDGHRTISAIVQVSPLHELQGLKLFDRLLERKMISL